MSGGPVTHGRSKTPEYPIWKGVIKRCCNPNASNFQYYGGCGIKVCRGIRKNFLRFYNAVGKRPSKKHRIDRIDNNLHYSCGKCKECLRESWPMNLQWSTHRRNCRHTRRTKYITYKGETLALMDWADRTGIGYMTISRRLTSGWSIHKALTTPPDMIDNQPNTLPRHLYKHIRNAYKTGKSLAQVGKLVGYAPSAVRKALLKMGIPIRNQAQQQRLLIHKGSHTITFQGKTKTIAQWSRLLNLRSNTILMRLNRGWSEEKALTTPIS